MGLKPHANPKDDGEAFFSGRLEPVALKDLNPTNRGYAAGGAAGVREKQKQIPPLRYGMTTKSYGMTKQAFLRWAGEGTGMTRIGYRMQVLRRAMILN
jgi:hypothetical protein